MSLRAVAVFTPNDFPTHTYIDRGGAELERQFRNALATPNAVVSLSGPSKSGKTVLVRHVVGSDNLIIVSGAEIKNASDIWDRILDWMGAPSSVTTHETNSTANQVSGSASGTGTIPLIASGTAQAGYQRTTSTASGSTNTAGRSGLAQVQREIANSSFVVLVDDFHYMPREIQAEAAKQIKAGAERGVRICVASVPHRADDVVRSNPELRGRTTNIDLNFWTEQELKKIAVLGFDSLNAPISDGDATRFAREACGSPQLMQSICLQACLRLGIAESQQLRLPVTIDSAAMTSVFEITSTQSDYSSLVSHMHSGPKTRGTERRVHEFTDGTRGDVYRCVLLAISQDPPSMGLRYTELMSRVQRVCVGDAPAGSSVKEACKQISNFAFNMYKQQRIIEWDEEADVDILNIVDPYFLFYIRSSAKIKMLGAGSSARPLS